MKKQPFTIIKRIMSGYVLIIIMIFTLSIAGVMILNENDKKITTDIPLLLSLKDFKFMISESDRLIKNWIYQPKKAEQKALVKLQTQSYPALKSKIESVAEEFSDLKTKDEIGKSIEYFDSTITIQQQIMEVLESNENYANPAYMDSAITLFNKQYLPVALVLNTQFNRFLAMETKSFEEAQISQKADNDLLTFSLKLAAILILLISGIIYWLTWRIVTDPINKVKEVILALGRGEIVNLDKLKNRNSMLDGYKNDEIGEMVGAIDILTEGIKSKTFFAEEIGKGNYEKEFQPLSDKDVMGKALLEMHDKLLKTRVEDEKRLWATEGLAKFGELLRKGSGNIEILCNDIIVNLIKYLDANQGSVFIVTEDDQNKEVLELKACYAWDRKKYIDMKINIGEGLVGQCWQEGETIYLSDFPENYIEITSGLGKANPNNLMIVPLKLNEKIYGIIEIASFKEFQYYQREFIEKIGESIASTISTVKINAQTLKLLQETQQQSEEMRAQDEEMRQNLEEMHATHEEMERNERETKKIIAKLQQDKEEATAREEKMRQLREDVQVTHKETKHAQLEVKA